MILIDLNVILDVAQKREPHYRASAAVLDRVVRGGLNAWIPAHAVTTIHYLVSHFQNTAMANNVVDWLLNHFEVAPTGPSELRRAHTLGWDDFEDAVVAVAAESHHCRHLITRNVTDFRDSPVPAVTPEEYLLLTPS
jgi:predicted nucleic acid-binding protein